MRKNKEKSLRYVKLKCCTKRKNIVKDKQMTIKTKRNGSKFMKINEHS